VKLFDPRYYSGLQREFERSMGTLLQTLCDQLDEEFPGATGVDTRLLRHLGDRIHSEDYRGWKVTGWIEELNDLLYFLELRRRVHDEDIQDLFEECEEAFYENSYLDELFPSGTAQLKGLDKRLSTLCARLSRQVMQEALFIQPRSVVEHAQYARRRFKIPVELSDNFERAEPRGVVPVRLEGDQWLLPTSTVRDLKQRRFKASVHVDEHGMLLAVGRSHIPLAEMEHGALIPDLRVEPITTVPGFSHVSVGPALKFGKDKTPVAVVAAPRDATRRLADALRVIDQVWPQGAENLARFTSRIIPIQARGVVSYSYRNRPQLSFINCYDRGMLDLVDDLIHENSHHHLNLLLRKFELRQGDHNQELFYSPWRRSLRSIHGILHATFTFTMGARLFERISTSAGKSGTLPKSLVLTRDDVLRARFRCLEEVAAVRYSIEDLRIAGRALKFLSPHGKALVELLAREINDVAKAIAPYRKLVERSAHGKALRAHEATLVDARAHYALK